MTPLNWQPLSEPQGIDTAEPAPILVPRAPAASADPWFAVAMGLIGVIAGYLIAIF